MQSLLSGLDEFWSNVSRAIDPSHPTTPTLVLAGVLILILALILAFAVRFLLSLHRLDEADRAGERASVVAIGTLPLTSFRRDGSPGDPLNIRCVGTAAQLNAAFVAAGWYRADEITVVTSFRISVDAVLSRQYSTAPVSDLFLYGRRQDYAFEQPGRSVRERDHVRFWDSGLKSSDGRAIWIGAATEDVAVTLSRKTHLPTHRISPKVDEERDRLVESLVATGWIIVQETAPGFGQPTIANNGFGDTYVTDGQVAVLVLADVPVLLPFVTHVRAPSSGLARILSRALRSRLPRAGRERGERLRQRIAERVTARGREEEPGES